MKLDKLSRPVRLFLSERLERLHMALKDLGQRLRAGIAQLVGSHIGEAVQDALAAALFRQPASPAPHPSYDPWPWPHEDPSHYEQDLTRAHTRPDVFWEESEPEQLPHRPQGPQPSSRWHSLVGGGVHLATLWYRHRPPPRSVLHFLGLGAIATLVTLVTGSLFGTVAATIGTALLMTTTADTATVAAQTVAELPAI